jgi:hypothetical protein
MVMVYTGNIDLTGPGKAMATTCNTNLIFFEKIEFCQYQIERIVVLLCHDVLVSNHTGRNGRRFPIQDLILSLVFITSCSARPYFQLVSYLQNVLPSGISNNLNRAILPDNNVWYCSRICTGILKVDPLADNSSLHSFHPDDNFYTHS